MNAVKRLLWWLLAGSAGGLNRGRILTAVFDRPYNANELSKVLSLDYKTIRHHLELLEKNKLIVSTGSGYGMIYSPSEMLETHYEIFQEIWGRIGKNEIKKNDTKHG